MTAETLAKAMQRVRAVLTGRPQAAIHADEPAIACWEPDLRVLSRHAHGTQIATDMPIELGGSGDQVTPGWLLRAAMASCLATRIAMEAAVQGIVLRRLEVTARSRSDARGLLGMTDGAGNRITPAPFDLRLEVRIDAPGAAREGVQAMIEESWRCSPVSAAIGNAVPVDLRIEIDPN